MATRLYFSILVDNPVTPSSWSAGWDKTTGTSTAGLALGHYVGGDGGATASEATGSAFASRGAPGNGASGDFVAIRRWIGGPLVEAVSIAGTVKGQMRCFQAASTDNYTLALAIKVLQSDGSDRGVLLAVTAPDNLTHEMVALTETNRSFRDASESASISLSSVNASAGDYIVVEVGFLQQSTSVGNGNILIGADGNSGDLAENETTTSSGLAPWIEFSQDLPLFGFAGHSSTPLDGATATNTTDPTVVDLTNNVGNSMKAGDLVLMIGHQRATGATLAVSATGGQTWNTLTAIGGTNLTARVFWCTFNGTWSADPSVDFSGTTCNSVYILSFRAPSGYTWSINQAQVEEDHTIASPVVTGQTTTGSNPTVTIAGIFSADDNTWTINSAQPWHPIGQLQIRNTSGSDQSATFAEKIQLAAGSTGNVSFTQATLGTDNSTSFIITFAAASAGSVGSASGTGTAVGRAGSQGVAAGTGAAAATGVGLHARTGAASGTGAAAAVGAVIRAAVGQGIGGLGVAAAVGESFAGATEATGTATGAGAVAGVGAATAASAGAAAGTGAVAAVGTGINARIGSATGTGAAAGVIFAGSVGSASGTGTASGQIGERGSAAGTGTAAALSIAIKTITGSASGTGAATGIGAATAAAVGSATGTGTAAGAAQVGTAVGSAAGIGAAAAVGTAIRAIVGNAAGTGAAAGVIFAGSIGSAAGTGTASGQIGLRGVAAGTGVATAVGAATAAATGSASGTGTAAALSIAIKAISGSAAGTGAATGRGAATAAAAGSAAGTGTATALSAAGVAVGSASGAGTAAAQSIAIRAATGSAAGTGAASAQIIAFRSAAGSAAGTGAAAAVGRSIRATTGAAAGSGAAVGRVGYAGAASGAGVAQAIATVTATADASAAGTGAATGVLIDLTSTQRFTRSRRSVSSNEAGSGRSNLATSKRRNVA